MLLPVLRIAVPVLAISLLGVYSSSVLAQAHPSSLLETGHLSVAGRELPYQIRNLPVSSFPNLPQPIADALTARGCVVPQTYRAHHPENVVHASLERSASSDWAVLCGVKGTVSLLVFFASASPEKPVILATSPETGHLQVDDRTGELGFNWGIDPASPAKIRDAQAGMAHHPPLPDHDCLEDTIIDHKTVYHLYRNGAWEIVEVE